MTDLPDIPVNSDWEHRRKIEDETPDTQRSP